METRPPIDDKPSEPEKTAAEWGARFERESRRTRFGCGLVLGAFAGLFVLAKAKWVHSGWLGLAVVAGVAIAIAFAFRRSNREGSEAIDWALFPEWRIFERMPTWMQFVVAVLAIIAFLSLFGLIGVSLFW